jgi:DNA-binding transcriptional LysR family regulator
MYDPNLLRPLAVFLSVAEHGSFRRAASDLGISAPLTSQIVAGLEESLGQQLFYRSTRKITLTGAGAGLVRKLQGAFEEIDNVLAAFATLTETPKGRLRITAPTVLAQPAFSRFLHGYAVANPLLTLEVDLSDEFRDPLQTGHDLAIRIGAPDGADRIQRRLFRTEGIICAGPGGRDWSLEDLENQIFVHPPNVPDQLTLRQGGMVHTITPANVLVVNHGGMVREILRIGGFGVFPAFAVQEGIAKGHLVRIAPEWSLGPIDVVALYTARRARLSLARHFVTELKSFIERL